MMFSPAMAQEAQTATTTQAGVPAAITPEKMMQDNLLILGLLFFVFYFMLIRPQQKRVRQHQEMLKGLQKGTKVITNGGLIGSVVKFEGDEVAVIEVAQGVRVRVAKAAISEVAGDKVAAGDIANDN